MFSSTLRTGKLFHWVTKLGESHRVVSANLWTVNISQLLGSRMLSRCKGKTVLCNAIFLSPGENGGQMMKNSAAGTERFCTSTKSVSMYSGTRRQTFSIAVRDIIRRRISIRSLFSCMNWDFFPCAGKKNNSVSVTGFFPWYTGKNESLSAAEFSASWRPRTENSVVETESFHEWEVPDQPIAINCPKRVLAQQPECSDECSRSQRY